VDLIVGLVLLVLVPVLCLTVAGLTGLSTRSDMYDFRERPQVNPAPDQEEIVARFQAAVALYENTSRPLLETAVSAHTRPDGLFFRRWAERSLEQAASAFQGLEALIKNYPDSAGSFQGYVTRSSQYRAQIQKDKERARALDVLGLDEKR
jgi:hypothetical protein